VLCRLTLVIVDSVNCDSITHECEGWILFLVATLVQLVVVILTSPFLIPGVSGAKRFMSKLP
jgi:hypothetical protein